MVHATTASTRYTGAISVATTTTIKAIAVAAGFTNSSVASAAYTIQTATPTPHVLACCRHLFFCAERNHQRRYGGCDDLLHDRRIDANHLFDNLHRTNLSNLQLDYQAIATAAASLPAASAVRLCHSICRGDSYFQSCSGYLYHCAERDISDTTPGATIYYTTDGSTPQRASTRYTGPISVATNDHDKAIAVAAGFTTAPCIRCLHNSNCGCHSHVLACCRHLFFCAERDH